MDSGNVVEFPNRRIGDEIPRRSEPPESPKSCVPVKAVVVIALGAVGLLAVGAYNFKAPAPRPVTGSFSTARGEHLCDRTLDKSVVCLNTGTVVRWKFDGLLRHFEVDAGEASFDVSPDSRPLEVGSRSLLVRDISTQFDVYRKSGSTVVTVVDGGVQLLARTTHELHQDLDHREPESAWKSAPIFHRLEQVEFDEATGTLLNHRLLTERNLSEFMAWRQGHVFLANTTLSDALQELSRYQPTDQKFTFQDREMRQIRIGGRVESTHMGDFLDWLERTHGIQHKLTSGSHGEAIVILLRQRNTERHRQPKSAAD